MNYIQDIKEDEFLLQLLILYEKILLYFKLNKKIINISFLKM